MESAQRDINGLFELHNELRGDIAGLRGYIDERMKELGVAFNLRMDAVCVEVRKETSAIHSKKYGFVKDILLVLVGALVAYLLTRLGGGP